MGDVSRLMLDLRRKLRRGFLWLHGWVKPSWRTLVCPRCNEAITARNGVHMTMAVHRHNDRHHPGWREQTRGVFERILEKEE